MKFGDIARKRLHLLLFVLAALAIFAAPQAAVAAGGAAQPAPQSADVASSTAPTPQAARSLRPTNAAPAASLGYQRRRHRVDQGQPTPGAIDFQKQYSPTGHYAYKMHTYVLMPIIIAITLFVLVLLLWVMVRYNRRRPTRCRRRPRTTPRSRSSGRWSRC